VRAGALAPLTRGAIMASHRCPLSGGSVSLRERAA